MYITRREKKSNQQLKRTEIAPTKQIREICGCLPRARPQILGSPHRYSTPEKCVYVKHRKNLRNHPPPRRNKTTSPPLPQTSKDAPPAPRSHTQNPTIDMKPTIRPQHSGGHEITPPNISNDNIMRYTTPMATTPQPPIPTTPPHLPICIHKIILLHKSQPIPHSSLSKRLTIKLLNIF